METGKTLIKKGKKKSDTFSVQIILEKKKKITIAKYSINPTLVKTILIFFAVTLLLSLCRCHFFPGNFSLSLFPSHFFPVTFSLSLFPVTLTLSLFPCCIRSFWKEHILKFTKIEKCKCFAQMFGVFVKTTRKIYIIQAC